MEYDILIIGGGPAGYNAALAAAQKGKTVALVEQDALGGTCLNRGCIPTKALLRSAALYDEMKREGEALGVRAQAAYDETAMHARAKSVVDTLRSGVEGLITRAKITWIKGSAVLVDEHSARVGEETIEARSILLAVGSSPSKPAISGIDLPGVLTSDELLSGQETGFSSLAIIGGGVIGAEFAQLYSDLHKDVTVIEALPRMLSSLDRELSQSLQMSFKKRGINVLTGATVLKIERRDGGLSLVYSDSKGEGSVACERVLLAVGRRPNTAGLLPAALAERLNAKKGYLPVNQKNQTAIPSIYAAGDIVLGGAQLAHAAEAEARNAVESMFGGGCPKRLSVIPSCVFTRPEIACAGLSADDAKAKGIAVTIKKSLTASNGKAQIEGAERGFTKLVFEAETEKLIGAQLLCPHAGEMIGTLAACINAGLTKAQLEQTVYPHPTVSETLVAE